MKFIIATNNAKKLVEMERILAPLGIEAVSARDAGAVAEHFAEKKKNAGKKSGKKEDPTCTDERNS